MDESEEEEEQVTERPRKRQRVASGIEPETVAWVVPQRLVTQRPLPHWTGGPAGQDFLWAILVAWDQLQIVHLMRHWHACMICLPTDEAQDGLGLHDTSFWREHYLPVLLPEPALLPPTLGFLRAHKAYLAYAEHCSTPIASEEEAQVLQAMVDAMRVAALVAVLHDMRVRHYVFVRRRELHGRLGVRPPERSRFWRFLEHGAGQATRDHVTRVEECIIHQEPGMLENTWAWNRALLHHLRTLWLTNMPLPEDASGDDCMEGVVSV